MTFDVVVIGAGAAGMMCAAEAGTRGRRVLLIDHRPTIGERIRISGGGRCNFSNRQVGAEHFLSHNRHFCRSALARFTTRDFLTRVERRGIRYHEREHGQLFCDDTAQDIVTLLKDACDTAAVHWMFPCSVDRIDHLAAPSAPGGPRFHVATTNGAVRCASIVVATGGLAVPQLGASPFGYRIAEQFGIAVIAPEPALVPLALQPQDLERLNPLSGVAFTARTRCAGGPPDGFTERILVTHRGLSGPAILQISSYWQFQAQAGRARGPIAIDLMPGEDAHRWLHERRESRVTLPNALSDALTRRFAHEWCALHGWMKPLNQFADAERRTDLGTALNAWSVLPSGTLGFAKAEVALGGVDTRGLSSKTMEATAVPGLFFIGEVVDVTGWLGGYNFQWAWSSGWVAGQYV